MKSTLQRKAVRVFARAAAFFTLTGLSDCAGFKEELARQEAAKKAAVNAADDEKCRSYGAQPGTDTYVACRMNIDNQRAQLEAAATVAKPGNDANNQRMMDRLRPVTAALQK
jgi:hypothetical protein